MKIKSSLLFILMAFILISCDKQLVFDEYKSVGNAWHQDSILTFKLPKLESEKKYNLFVNVRDNNDYPFDNLFDNPIFKHDFRRLCFIFWFLLFQ